MSNTKKLNQHFRNTKEQRETHPWELYWQQAVIHNKNYEFQKWFLVHLLQQQRLLEQGKITSY